MSVFKTFSFIVSCVGVVVCITAMFFVKAVGLPKSWIYTFFGNGCLCAIGVWSHWYLQRTLTPKRSSAKKDT